MGGDCLNYGCVPSKSLLAAAKLADAWRRGAELGIAYAPPQIDFAAVGDSVARVIARLAPNDSVERFEGLGVRVLRAEARFIDPRTRARRRARRSGRGGSSSPPARRRSCRRSRASTDVPFFTNETVFANRTLPRAPDRDRRRPDRHRAGAGPSPARRRGHGDRRRPAAAARRSRAGRRCSPRAWRPKASRCGPRPPIAGDRARRDGDRGARWRAASASPARICWSPPAGGPNLAALDLAGRRHRRQRARASSSTRGCARPTAAPLRSATPPAARNSPMSRSIMPGS